MKTTKLTAAIAAGALLTAAAPGLAASKRSVDVRHTKLGNVLVDSHGMTLYLFMKDKYGKSACAGTCAKVWAPLLTKSKPTAGQTTSAKLLGTTRRADGTTQVTYRGHPLYRYDDDEKPGQTKGEGSKEFGAEWYVLSPKGVKVETKGS